MSLGFECPLYVPVPEPCEKLGCGREVDGNRPFSAGAGAASLVTGLVQLCWVLRDVRRQVREIIRPTLCYEEFDSGEANFFLWEAFVSGTAKKESHLADARAALEAYQRRCGQPDSMPDSLEAPSGEAPSGGAPSSHRTCSLMGAALLWAGLTDDPAILHRPCCVVKAAIA